MDLNLIYLPWVAAAALVVVVLLAKRHFDRKRAAELTAQALRLGLEPAGASETPPEAGLEDMPLFGQGRGRTTSNVLRDGNGITVFDYSYTVGGGRNSSTYQQTVAAVRVGGEIPRFRLSPETVLHRIGHKLGMQDIDFATHPEFSKNYQLSADDEAAIREWFSAAVLDHFNAESGWTVEGAGPWILAYRTAERVAPTDLGAFLDRVRAMRSAIERR